MINKDTNKQKRLIEALRSNLYKRIKQKKIREELNKNSHKEEEFKSKGNKLYD